MSNEYKDDCNEDKNTYQLKIPKDISLSFLAYNIFKPRQVAFSRIKEYIDEEICELDYRSFLSFT